MISVPLHMRWDENLYPLTKVIHTKGTQQAICPRKAVKWEVLQCKIIKVNAIFCTSLCNTWLWLVDQEFCTFLCWPLLSQATISYLAELFADTKSDISTPLNTTLSILYRCRCLDQSEGSVWRSPSAFHLFTPASRLILYTCQVTPQQLCPFLLCFIAFCTIFILMKAFNITV